MKYLLAIHAWQSKRTHNLLELHKLYGKLLHASLICPQGRAYLTNLEAMFAAFGNNPFIPHTPPCSTPFDLDWWADRLSHPSLSHTIPGPKDFSNVQAS